MWEYRVTDISDLTGLSVWTIRKDIRDGRLEPDSLRKVVEYVENRHRGREDGERGQGVRSCSESEPREVCAQAS